MQVLILVGVALAVANSAAADYYHGTVRATVIPQTRDLQSSYDYVIVGGGTSGLTVADRLTEDGKTTVLVIEHGDFANSTLISTVQGGFQAVTGQFMYSITSQPQTNLKNHTAGVLAGKVVGGSSAVNAMMTVRGTTEDYDRWGAFFGSNSTAGWSWDGLLPYFRKALNFVPPNPDVAQSSNITYDTSFWGNTSGVYVGWPSFQYPGTKAQVDAFRGMPGIDFPPDSGSGKPGVYWFPQFMDPRTATRSYARTGHYLNVPRPNYQLIAGSKVLRILLNGTTATGVRFVPAANPSAAATVIQANKEVILAAGAVHSPQILQRSGVGPQKLLNSAKIATVVDLPGVGQNFQDHPMLQMRVTLRNFNFKPSSADLYGNATFRSWADSVWAQNKTGPYSIATGNAAAWLSFPSITSKSDSIAARLAALDPASALPAGTDPSVVAGYGAQLQSLAAGLRGNKTAFYNLGLTGAGSNGILVDLHPLSRGSVQIDPVDPDGREPLVDYRALSNPVDAAVMAEIVRFTRRYYLDNPRNAPYSPAEASPGANVQTDEQIAAWLADTLSPTEYHPAGTCAMMPRELGGVVDQTLRVYGVGKLRIVDASVMPTLPGGNTCQTVYAVAEKAADIIKSGV